MLINGIAGYIDHTLLKPETRKDDITRLCREAREYNFYAVCINSSHVINAVAELAGSPVKVCCVAGFPLGASSSAVKAYEAFEALAAGAEEIDMVMHIGALISGDEKYVINDISAVVKASGGRLVKVIIETGMLTKSQKILACRLAVQAGAGFVKTSTGFGPGGATVSDIRLMREKVGPGIGVKASGGVRTAVAARDMIAAGANRIGTSSGIAIVKGLSGC